MTKWLIFKVSIITMYINIITAVSRMAGLRVVRWQSCNHLQRDIAGRMRSRVHLLTRSPLGSLTPLTDTSRPVITASPGTWGRRHTPEANSSHWPDRVAPVQVITTAESQTGGLRRTTAISVTMPSPPRPQLPGTMKATEKKTPPGTRMTAGKLPLVYYFLKRYIIFQHCL